MSISSKAKSGLFLLLTTLLLASCGQQHDAEDLIRDFLNENLEVSDRTNEQFSRLDSTKHVTPQRVGEMRRKANDIAIFKKGIIYPQNNRIPSKLLLMNVKYTLTDMHGREQDYMQTFYMDKELSRVVAFKEN